MWLLYNNNNKIINENITTKMCKTSTKQIFCSQNYYNIVFYYNSQNTQLQVLENRKQKIVTKHILSLTFYALCVMSKSFLAKLRDVQVTAWYPSVPHQSSISQS